MMPKQPDPAKEYLHVFEVQKTGSNQREQDRGIVGNVSYADPDNPSPRPLVESRIGSEQDLRDLMFTALAEFRQSQHFQALAGANRMDNALKGTSDRLEL